MAKKQKTQTVSQQIIDRLDEAQKDQLLEFFIKGEQERKINELTRHGKETPADEQLVEVLASRLGKKLALLNVPTL